MAQAFINVGNVPPSIEARATELLDSARPRKLKYIAGEVIEVGRRYRLFRSCRATCFSLMTHERYSSLTAKKKRRG
jgi:hypothetical protein